MQPTPNAPRVAVHNRTRRPVKNSEHMPRSSRFAPSARAVRSVATAALKAERFATGELSIVLVTDAAIRKLNAAWRGKNVATNVLSFPQNRRRGLLGDVVVSLETVARQGRQTGAGYDYTLAFYLVHGILHLLGWDHDTPKKEREMMRRTREILKAAGVR